MRPRFFNRRNDAPLRLYFVSARKERCIATHRVEQQSFVRNWTLRPEARLIGEVGLNRHGTHLCSWSLGVERDRDSLVRLNANCDDIRINTRRRAGKQCLWRWFKMYADLRQIACKMLPSSDVERNSSPSPVLNLKLYRRVGFRYGVAIHARLLPITRYAFPVNHAGTILPSSGESRHILDTHWPNGSKYLHLLFTHRIRIKRYRRLHRSQREQLKQMVRHHIAQGAGFFVECRSVLNSDRFSRGDLHIVDVVPV